jgi:predicted dehydrogenase
MTEAPLHVGVLGCAHFPHAASYVRAFNSIEGVRAVALYEEDKGLGQKFAESFKLEVYHQAPEQLLERSDIEAVLVCSPTDQHARLVIASAQAGKHVLCEKPIATRKEDAYAMIEVCQSAGVQLHLAFVCRFYPFVQSAKRMVASGEIGEVLGIMGGNRGRAPLSMDWMINPVRAGGGALIDHSVHVTDAIRFILECDVESVYAETGNLIHTDIPVEDCGLMLLEFTNGVVASVDFSWSLPHTNLYHYDFFLHILGSEGVIQVDDTKQAVFVAGNENKGRGAHLEPFGVNVDAEMVRHFVRGVREGEVLPPSASGMDGLRTLEIALGAYESARRGQPVVLSNSKR